MKIAVLGTGMVGVAFANKLVSLGHDVVMGSRTADNPKALAWARDAGAAGGSGAASAGTFADAAAGAELLFLCCQGSAAIEVLASAGAANLARKVVVDVTNPLDFSRGMPPSLFTGPHDSLGEQIQSRFPEARVVKALNTVTAQVMVDAARVAGAEHDAFMCGNDAAAKGQVREILTGWFGWKHVTDLGDITGARATEAYLHLWLRLWSALGTADFNVRVVR